MNHPSTGRYFGIVVLMANAAWGAVVSPATSTPVIPKVWDDAIMPTLELPSVEPAYTPQQIKADYYYRIPVRPIYRSYPVYRPDKEPKGYYEEPVSYTHLTLPTNREV